MNLESEQMKVVLPAALLAAAHDPSHVSLCLLLLLTLPKDHICCIYIPAWGGNKPPYPRTSAVKVVCSGAYFSSVSRSLRPQILPVIFCVLLMRRRPRINARSRISMATKTCVCLCVRERQQRAPVVNPQWCMCVCV